MRRRNGVDDELRVADRFGQHTRSVEGRCKRDVREKPGILVSGVHPFGDVPLEGPQ
jgi:hypothetical protein